MKYEIYINEIVVRNKLPFGKQDFKYFIGCKDNKKIRSLCLFFPKMSTYRSFDKYSKYFMIKEEKFLINITKFGKKVSNIIKQNLIVSLCTIKIYIKAENKINTKKSFQCFYIPVISIDSVYEKNENYYLKVFLEKYNFSKDIEIYFNKSYYADSDKECYDEKRIDLFLETIRRIL